MAGRVSRKDFALFNLELANLLRSGLPLSAGLKQISREVRGDSFRAEIERISERLDQGVSLSGALAAVPGVFSPYYITLVRAGETGGNLAEVLSHITRYTQFQYRTAEKIKTGLAYPIAELGLATLILTFILVLIVPRFIEFYEAAGARLPAPTRGIVLVSNLLCYYSLETLLGIAGVIAALVISAKYLFRPLWDYAKLHLPLVGNMVRWALLVHYCEVVGYLLKQGVPVVDALRIAAGTTRNTVVSSAFEQVAADVERGRRVSQGMQLHAVFPRSLVWMVSVAEEQERLDAVLQDAAFMYMERFEDWSDRITGVIEPLIFLFLGLAIGYIVIALYLPLFKIGDVL